ncbi:TRM11 family SAM-dependent methyltransferase [Paenibacillus solisilvae]|uniref:TRM11 family SAM-dependent methyltransferase n=1 Tax=Paenibacillus solisilvae TaxID=2486751 RepID=A0ABW0W1L3_9BACL
MSNKTIEALKGQYVYTIAFHEDEEELCRMEMRALFGVEPIHGCVRSDKNLDPSRSPFIRGKLAVDLEASDVDGIAGQAGDAVHLQGQTFKVVFMETDDRMTYEQQRSIERQVGWRIRGKAEMRRPDRLLGIACVKGSWLFGAYEKSEAVWLKHNKKPQPYSTALSTRVARAVVNIAAGDSPPDKLKLIDPCCGIGTVVIEALSMGIDIIGYDHNPLALKGARVNLAHFEMPDVVARADMRTLDPAGDSGGYDAAIIDLPYNLCSVLSAGERLDMLLSARRLAKRVLIVTTETIDDTIMEAGLHIVDRCTVRKGSFSRQIIACKS